MTDFQRSISIQNRSTSQPTLLLSKGDGIPNGPQNDLPRLATLGLDCLRRCFLGLWVTERTDLERV